jgi:hypothetical protein
VTQATDSSGNGRASLGALIRELADDGARLVRGELRLARLEFQELLRGVSIGGAQVVAGGVMALLGGLALLTGLILLAGDQWLGDHYWFAALIMALLLFGLALWLAMRGMSLLSSERLVPDETLATLKEDKEWLRRQLKSGATSS